MKAPIAGLPAPHIQADFNGLFGSVLCLSHADAAADINGTMVAFEAGMRVTAFDADEDDEGRRDYLVAVGTVQPSPTWLSCHGSRWILEIDSNGVRHESDRQ